MTEFGLWWIGVGVLAVGWLINMAICGNFLEKNKHRVLFYSFFWESVMCVLVGGVDICCALWSQKLCGVIGWYIASAVICILAGIICLWCAIDEHKKEKSSDLKNLSYETSDSYAKEVKNIVEQLKSTANRLNMSTDTCRFESQSFERLQKERLQLRNGVKKVVDIKKGYVVRTTRSWIVMLITLVAVVGSCFLVNELVPKTNATYTLNEEGNYVVSGKEDGVKDVVISSRYNGKPVVGIGDNAFSDCAELETVIISNGIKNIGENAFRNCTGLKEIVFPDSIEIIGFRAFNGCSGLKNVEFPKSLKHLSQEAFLNCDGLESVIWNAEDCTEAGSYTNPVFGEEPKFTTLTIGTNVKTLPRYLLRQCSSLTNVVYNAEACSSSDFYGCSIFEDCVNLKTVTIGDKVREIPAYLFSNATLTSIVIPSSVYTIGEMSFANCRNLISLEISEGVVIIDSDAFLNCDMLKNVTIPDSVIVIPRLAFNGCGSLTNLKIGEGVVSIQDEAFFDCESLERVEFYGSVTSIGKKAFKLCWNLTKIVFHGTKEQWKAVEKGYDWYSNSGLTIVCSDGSLDVFGSEK